MVTLITLALIAGIAIAAGYFLCARAWFLLLLLFGGWAVMGVVFFVAVVPESSTYTGIDSAGVDEISGHWVPAWKTDLLLFAALVWLIGIPIGRGVRIQIDQGPWVDPEDG